MMFDRWKQRTVPLLRAAALGCGLAGLGGAGWAAEPPPRDRPFPDVPRSHWAYDAVEELRQLGILRGYRPEAAPAPPKRPSERAAPAPHVRQKQPAKRRAPASRRPLGRSR